MRASVFVSTDTQALAVFRKDEKICYELAKNTHFRSKVYILNIYSHVKFEPSSLILSKSISSKLFSRVYLFLPFYNSKLLVPQYCHILDSQGHITQNRSSRD